MTSVSDPRGVLAARLQRAVAQAFGADYADVDAMVRRSDRADFQADLAMGLAKALKRPPRQVAEAVTAAADLTEWDDWTPRDLFEAVLSKPVDPPAERALLLTDDRPFNEYYLVRRLRAGEEVLKPAP